MRSPCNYEAQVVVLNDGGTLESPTARSRFKKANSLTMLSRCRHGLRSRSQQRLARRISASPPSPRGSMPRRKRLMKNCWPTRPTIIQALFGRVTLDLGPADSATASLPTDKRLANYENGGQRHRRWKPAVPVWPVSADQFVAAGRAAGQFAGQVEPEQHAAVALRLSHRHQRADELLAGGRGQLVRVFPALCPTG